jgi:sortase A
LTTATDKLAVVREERFGSWSRAEEKTVYHRPRRFHQRHLTLGLFGAALILLSVGWVFAEAQIVANDSFAAPKEETMKLTIPRMKRVNNIPVYTGTANDKAALRNGTLHLKNTGFPWEEEANVYPAGHRLGYPNTESFLVFWDLNKLKRGDKVVLKTPKIGTTYTGCSRSPWYHRTRYR